MAALRAALAFLASWRMNNRAHASWRWEERFVQSFSDATRLCHKCMLSDRDREPLRVFVRANDGTSLRFWDGSPQCKDFSGSPPRRRVTSFYRLANWKLQGPGRFTISGALREGRFLRKSAWEKPEASPQCSIGSARC